RYRLKGKLHTGVKLEHGGTLRVELNHKSFLKLQEIFLETTNDNRILAVALNLQMEERERQSSRAVILVSKDALVRVKADALGIQAEDFLSDQVIQYAKSYPGYIECQVSSDLINAFYTDHKLNLKL